MVRTVPSHLTLGIAIVCRRDCMTGWVVDDREREGVCIGCQMIECMTWCVGDDRVHGRACGR
jgi:hypothetical protein